MTIPNVILDAIKNQFESPITKAIVHQFCSGRLPEPWDTPERVLEAITNLTQSPVPAASTGAADNTIRQHNAPEIPLFFFTGTRREYETGRQKVGRTTDYSYRIPVYSEDMNVDTDYDELHDRMLECTVECLDDGTSDEGWITDDYGDLNNVELTDSDEDHDDSESDFDDAWQLLFGDSEEND